MELSMTDLRHVRALLYPIRKKWYDIGIELDIDVAELDIIRDKYDDPADCLLEMIKLWLRSINPLPTWSILADALRAEAVNEEQLAGEASMKERNTPWSHQEESFYEDSPKLSSPQLHKHEDFAEENFPFLIMSRMTRDEKSRLLTKLEGESKTIGMKFGALVTTIGQSMEKSDNTIEDLKLFLDSCGMNQLADSISSSETLIGAMRKISREKYWSFFNYELFESMSTALCKSQDAVTHLRTYKSDFQVYCTRRLFHVPAIVFENARPNSDSVLKFYIKIDKNFTVSVNDIKTMQHNISMLLDVHPLYLIDVKDGCIELTFGCFKSTEELFPEERQKEITKRLAELKVVEFLQCGEVKIGAESDIEDTVTEEGKRIADENTQVKPNSLNQQVEPASSSVPLHESTCPAELSDEEKQSTNKDLDKGPKVETNERATDKERSSDSPMSISNEDVAVPAWKIRKISKHPSYHGAIDRKRAEYKLSRRNSNCYLTRYSEDKDQHTLSIRRRKEEEWIFRNFDIVTTRNDGHVTYEIQGTEEKFDDITDLLSFYKENSLDHHIDAIGEELMNDDTEKAACETMVKIDSQEKFTEVENAEPTERTRPLEPSIRLKPRQYPCLIERGSDGKVTFVSTETGKKFSQSLELLEYSDVTKSPKNYDGKIREANELSSFHGTMSRDEAETRLREQESNSCYLIRYSESREELTLSVMRRKEDDYIFQNFNIVEPEECPTSYEIYGSDDTFDSIAELLEFYRKNPLNHNIDSIGDEIINGDKILSVQEDTSTKIEAEKVSSTEVEPSCTQNLQKLISKEGLQNAVPRWALQAMKNHPSFHGSLTRIEAVKRLIESGRSCYLTRYSSYIKCCVITVLRMSANGEWLQHLELELPQSSSQHTYKAAGADKSFEDVSQLLEYYQKNPLNREGYCLGECLQSDKSMELTAEDQNEITGTEEQDKEPVPLSRPTKSNLRCITYMDKEGQTHDFKLMKQVSDRWFKAGLLLRLSKPTLDKYRDKASDDVKSCEYVFFKWIKNNGHEDYPLTWVGLHTLLIDMGRRTAAEKLYKVLKNRETKEDKYVDTMYRVVC